MQVPLDASRLLRVRERIRDYLRSHCQAGPDVDDVVLAVEEACTNAIRHSCAKEDAKVSLAFDHDRLSVVVADHGVGFDPGLFRPDRVPDLLAPGGRGLFLISRLVDDLHVVCAGGTQVHMGKRMTMVSSEERRRSLARDMAVENLAGVGEVEGRLLEILENLSDGFLAVDWEWRYIYANRAGSEAVRLPREELIGRRVWDVFPSLVGTEFERHFRLAMEQGLPSHFESFFDPFGEWFEVRLYPTSSGISLYFNDVTERKRIEEQRDKLLQQLQQELGRTTVLQDVADAAAGTLSLRQVCRRALDRIREHFEPAAASIYSIDRDRGELRHLAHFGYAAVVLPMIRSLPVSDSSNLGRLVLHDLDVLTDASGGDPPEAAQRLARLGLEGSRWVALPLRSKAETLGAMVLFFRRDAALDAQEVDLYRSVAATLATAMANARLYEGERSARVRELRRAERSDTLHAVARLSLASVDEGELAEALLTEMKERLGLLSATIRLVDAGGGSLIPVAAIRPGVAGPEPPISISASHVTATAFATGEPVFIADTAAQPLPSGTQALLAQMGPGGRALCALPLKTPAATVGTLSLTWPQPGPWDDEAMSFHLALANAVAVGLSNARLYEDQQRSARLSEALNELDALIHSTLDVGKIMARVVKRSADVLGVDAAAIELDEGDTWPVRYVEGLPDTVIGRSLTGNGIISRSVRQSGGALILSDAQADQRVGPAVAESGIRSFIAVPLVVREGVFGVLIFVEFGGTRRFRQVEVDFALKLGTSVSLALENARLYREADERQHLNSALNAIASSITSLLDYEEILSRVVAQAGEAIGAESSAICSVEPSGYVPRYVWHIGPEVVDVLIPKDRVPYANLGVESRQVVAVTDSESDARVDVQLQREWNVRSVIMAPLVVRSQVVAALFVNYQSRQHEFTIPEIDFIAKAAAIISGALENARLYEVERRVAATLQENLIHPLPQVPGVTFGLVSQSANEPELVGGDFFDAFQLEEWRLVVVVGDVAGKGIQAAGLTETVRSATRALALVDPSPSFILGRVGHMLGHQEPHAQFVTLQVMVIDLRDGSVRFGSAGHPPAVLVQGGAGRLLEPLYGPPLGAIDWAYEESRAQLRRGDTVVLYTDGVTEARIAGVLFGEKRLLEAVSALSGRDPQSIAEGLRDAVSRFADALRDDLQIVVFRLEEPRT